MGETTFLEDLSVLWKKMAPRSTDKGNAESAGILLFFFFDIFSINSISFFPPIIFSSSFFFHIKIFCLGNTYDFLEQK